MGFFDDVFRVVADIATGGLYEAGKATYEGVVNGANDDSAWKDLATAGVYNTLKGYENYTSTGKADDIWQGWWTALQHGGNNPIANGANSFGTSIGTSPQRYANTLGLMDDETYDKNKQYTQLAAQIYGMGAIGNAGVYGAGGAEAGGSAGSVPYGEWTGAGGEAAVNASGQGLVYGSPEYLAASSELGLSSGLGLADYYAAMPQWAQAAGDTAWDAAKSKALDYGMGLLTDSLKGKMLDSPEPLKAAVANISSSQVPVTQQTQLAGFKSSGMPDAADWNATSQPIGGDVDTKLPVSKYLAGSTITGEKGTIAEELKKEKEMKDLLYANKSYLERNYV